MLDNALSLFFVLTADLYEVAVSRFWSNEACTGEPRKAG